ncbi:MAG: thioredoxin domain-containing protein [Actinobacteria bacterium]|nr:thioredoxin domain-containing protein [Actinomycetota bacterium]
MSEESTASKPANRLAEETSPYLLQHAHNPVDWYPWGDEALQLAEQENKPLFISIGYSACHWCHVMERESFEDPKVAEQMNRDFVCIKVDREERPDLDAIYMDAVQGLTGQGGWPMSVFASPEGIPFFGGTYFPPDDRHGLPSFSKVLGGVARAWSENGDRMVEGGKQLVARIVELNAPPKVDDELSKDLLDDAVSSMERVYDSSHGGFGSAPKFPQPPVLEMLLRRAPTHPAAAEMVETTLRRMALGGIYDQVGGGFSRYSVDSRWLVPHFEKMLYDNAQLARVYTRAWQFYSSPLFKRIAVETLEYVLRDLTDPSGYFYASEDADSEGVEGKFYVWDYQELVDIAPEAARYYGVTEAGNFERHNILTAASDGPPVKARRKLFEAREKRVRPGLDTKALTSWNGLTITALAEAGMAFDRPDFVEAAEKAAAFLVENVKDSSGRLKHSYKDGRARVLGMLEDYAYLAEALFTLWEATFEPRWLEQCRQLTGEMLELFWDEADGGLFSTGSDHEQLIMRQKEIVESVTPAPNAVAALVLLKLAELTGDGEPKDRAGAIIKMAQAYMAKAPQACGTYVCALDFYLSTPKAIVIVGEGKEAAKLIDTVWGRFVPNKVLAGSPPGIDSPLLEGKTTVDGRPTAFVCENFACQAPTSDPKVLAEQLSRA